MIREITKDSERDEKTDRGEWNGRLLNNSQLGSGLRHRILMFGSTGTRPACSPRGALWGDAVYESLPPGKSMTATLHGGTE